MYSLKIKWLISKVWMTDDLQFTRGMCSRRSGCNFKMSCKWKQFFFLIRDDGNIFLPIIMNLIFLALYTFFFFMQDSLFSSNHFWGCSLWSCFKSVERLVYVAEHLYMLLNTCTCCWHSTPNRSIFVFFNKIDKMFFCFQLSYRV